MKHLLILFLVTFLLACQNHSNQNETLNYLSNEITHRQRVLNDCVIKGDSMHKVVLDLDVKISNFILLSKDIENSDASVNLANTYFDERRKYYLLEDSAFTKLEKGMHVDDIAIILKQNELNLLNQLIFKFTTTSNSMYTAH